MLRNATPLIIVLVVIAVGVGGIFYLSNSNPPTQSSLDTNQVVLPTVAPTSAIISPQPAEANDATVGANMDNYVTTADGLKYLDEVQGAGQEVKTGDTVTVNYVGTLVNGVKFDSSYDRNTPFTTQIGVGQVIRGWDEGIVGMRVGGKRKLIVPADLGYGAQAVGSIPANSTLIFQVELLSVK